MNATQELQKPTPTPVSHFAHLSVAVLDAEIPAAQLMRRTLSTLGITTTAISRDPQETLALLKDKPMDMLIVEWECKHMNGLEVARYIRSPEFPHRMIPIILTTFNTDPAQHLEARNAGIDEIILKPFATKGVATAISNVIDNPRDFIITRHYAGPDRRAGEPVNIPQDIQDRRSLKVEPIFIDRSEAGEIYYDDVPRIILPDFQLKQRLEIASNPDASGLPQDIVRRLEESYQAMMGDMMALRQAFRNMLAGSDAPETALGDISKYAVAIRTRALRSRYTFAARVASCIHDFSKLFKPGHPQHALVMEKHIETLQAILSAKLEGEENPIGTALLQELQALSKRYA